MADFNKRNKKPKTPKMGRNEEGTPKPTKPGTPDKPTTSPDSMMYANKSFSSLAYNPITVYAEPGKIAGEAAQVYPPLARTNKVIDAVYGGQTNYLGNIVGQVITNPKSKLLHTFDYGRMALELNYRYLAIKDTDVNKAYNRKMGDAIKTVLSFAYGQQYLELPFFRYRIETDMPEIDANHRGELLISYQTFLQNCAAVPTAYASMLKMVNEMKRTGWRREEDIIQDLIGQYRKTGFSSVMTATFSFLKDQYFDKQWYIQTNTLTQVPSRKSQGIDTPTLTVTGIHRMATVRAKLSADQSDYEYDTESFHAPCRIFNKASSTWETQELSFIDVIKKLLDDFSIYEIVKWARRRFSGDPTQLSTIERFDQTKAYLDCLQLITNEFKDQINDILTALDKMNTLRLNYWVKGTIIEWGSKDQISPDYNVLVADLYRANGSSAAEMYYQGIASEGGPTLRWRFQTLWNKFTGINRFDKESGAAFISMSLRKLVAKGDDDHNDTKWILPILFTQEDTKMRFVNRYGFEVEATPREMSLVEIANDRILSRLVPFQGGEQKMRIVRIDTTAATDVVAVTSAAYMLIEQLFDMGEVAIQWGAAKVYDKILASDAYMLIDVELDDPSQEMISYAECYSPFRTMTGNASPNIGFKAITPSGK